MATVLVSGGTRGIGAAIAEKFKKSGYNVVSTYFCDDNEALAFSKKTNITAIKCDGENIEAVKAAIDKIHSLYGKINVLVNNAGVCLKQGLFTDFSFLDYQKVFGCNVFGMMNLTKAVIPDMLKLGEGKIVNIGSVFGEEGGSCEAIYSASKGAVSAFTKAMAKELGLSNITVNCVAPGFIDTRMNSHLKKEEIKEFLNGVALGRAGSCEEVAEVVYFLASKNARYVTGTVIKVDGGI